jgi:pimeloyl-ACP methyl ester carboxylesterase
MKNILLLSLLVIISANVSAQTEPTNYRDAVSRFKRFYNADAIDSVFNMFDDKMQAALPIDKTGQVMQQLKTQLGSIHTTELKSFENGIAVYKITYANGIFALRIVMDAENKISGLLVQPYQEDKVNILDPALIETPITVKTDGAVLSGSLVTPKNISGKMPVVLIIAGSGPTDRNGNSSGLVSANSYFLLAEALGKAGIASVRYDKRMIGKSTSETGESEVRFEDFVNDAIGFINQLKADARFSKVIVLGHSEGSLVGMLAATREKVDGYISVSGAGDVINNILAIQLKNGLPQEYKGHLARLDSLSKGMMVKGGTDMPLYRESVQPYLISWMKYDPTKEIKKVKANILIIQGTNDMQVSVDNAQNLKKARPDATLILIDAMNHVLKDAPADRERNLATYTDPSLPLDTKLVDAVVQFVNGVK